MYSFTSHWLIPAKTSAVMQALLQNEHWQSWWPGLSRVTVLHQAEGIGSQYRCSWHSNTGYVLTTDITVTNYSPNKLIAFDSGGDLVGTGRFELSSRSYDVTDITIHWNVAPAKRWMQ